MNSNWERISIGDISEKRNDFEEVDREASYEIVGVKRSGLGLAHKEAVRGDSMKFSKLLRLESGDLVYRVITAFEAPVTVVPSQDAGKLVTPQTFPVFRLNDKRILPEFMALLATYPSFHRAMAERCTGTVLRRKTLSVGAFQSIPVDLPPLAEQQRIVDLIGSLDEAIEAADEQVVSTQSLLTTHLSRLYEGSERVQLGKLGEIQIGFPFKSANFKDSGIRLLRGNNISPGALKWSGAQHVDSEEVTDRQQDYHLALGDVVIAMDAPIISSRVKASKVTQADLPSLLVQRVARIRVPQEDVRNAVALALHSSEFKSYLLRAQTGAFAPHITKSDISDFSVPRSLLTPENLDVGVALDERIKMTKASSNSLRKLRSELLTALLSGAHAIPESYDQPVLEIAA